MYYCTRKTRFIVASLVLTLFIAVEIWSVNDDLSSQQSNYDAKHLQLLKDYKNKRSKKITNNVINGPLHPLPTPQLPLKHHEPDIKPVITGRPMNNNDTTHHYNIRSTQLEDIFIAVKSSGKFHHTRLPLLLDTWIPLGRQSTYLITDTEDNETSSRLEPGHYHKSVCSDSHFRQGLVCKVSLAYDLYMQSQRRWFCVADDDTYINIPNLLTLLKGYDHTDDWYIGRPSLKYPIRVTIDDSKQAFWFHTGGAGYCISQGLALKMSTYAMGGRLRVLADKIRVPDDVAVGYIINKKLGVEITRVGTFHSHLEGLWRLDPHDLKNQITLSYGEFESGPNNIITNIVNTGGVIPTFPPTADPTRLKSVHCYLFPHALQCKMFGVASL